jgi:PAS domain S-box-containing protein
MVPQTSPGGIKYLACADYDIGYVRGLLRNNLLQSIAIAAFFLLLGVPIILIYTRLRSEYYESLQESEEQYRTLVDNIPGVNYRCRCDEHWTMEFISDEIENLSGYPATDFIQNKVRSYASIINSEDQKISDRIALESIARKEPYTIEYRIIAADGTVRWCYENGQGIFNEQGELYYLDGVIVDITERKLAEEKLLDYQAKLKSLASQLSVTEERERRRIATELHDQIGQSLVFSKIKLDQLHHSATSCELTKALDEICNNIGQIIQDTRTLTFDLSSPILNELGLEAAVSDWLDVQIHEKHGIETEFEDDGQPKPLDEDIQALLFRNVRELLINVVKHANAQNVKVSLCKVDDFINISVEDNGKGFDPTEVASKATFGLFSIRERLEQLDGSFEMKSEPGSGSKFSMKVPLKKA